MKENEAVDNERIVIDNVNEVKSKTSIQKYYFEKVQSDVKIRYGEKSDTYLNCFKLIDKLNKILQKY